MTHITALIKALFEAIYTSYGTTSDWYGIDLRNLKDVGLTVGSNPSRDAQNIRRIVTEARDNPGAHPNQVMLRTLQQLINSSIYGGAPDLNPLFIELMPCYVEELPFFYDCLILTMKILYLNGFSTASLNEKNYIYVIGAVNLKSDFLENTSSISDLDLSNHTLFFTKMAYGRSTISEYRGALIPFMIATLSQVSINKTIIPDDLMGILKSLQHSPDHNLRIDTQYVIESLRLVDNINISSLTSFIFIPEDRLSPGTFVNFERTKLEMLKELWSRGRSRVDAELGGFFQYMKRNLEVVGVDYKDYMEWLSELKHANAPDNIRTRTRLFGMIHLLESAQCVLDKNNFTLVEAVCALESLDADVLVRLDLKVLYDSFGKRALNIELPWWLYCVGIIHILTLNNYPTLFKLEHAIEDIRRISLSHIVQFDPNRSM